MTAAKWAPDELFYQPAPVGPRRCSDPQTIESRFEAFHAAHPRVWRAFVDVTMRAIHAGKDRIGAKAVWEVMRWDMWLATDDATPQLNNDYTALYARKFAREYPRLAHVFEFRRRKGSE